MQNIIETAREAGSFTSLLAAVHAAGLEATLRGDGPFTVFAPTDEAFANVYSAAVSLQNLFSTHPPLEERIERVRPGFAATLYRSKRRAQVEEDGR